MSDKKVKQAMLMLTGALRPELLCYSMTTAARKLKVTDKYVFELINKGHLQRLIITDTAGEEIGRAVTIDSVNAYMKREKPNRWAKRQVDAFDAN